LNFGSGEVATGPRSESPIIDVEAVSDEESEAKQSVVGQSLAAAHSPVWIDFGVVHNLRCCVD
jgi:hypothetical protein